jgi:hypothetical protein
MSTSKTTLVVHGVTVVISLAKNACLEGDEAMAFAVDAAGEWSDEIAQFRGDSAFPRCLSCVAGMSRLDLATKLDTPYDRYRFRAAISALRADAVVDALGRDELVELMPLWN